MWPMREMISGEVGRFVYTNIANPILQFQMKQNVLCSALLLLSAVLFGQATTAIPLSGVATDSITAQVDRFILLKMQDLHIPGASLAVVRNGNVVYAKGYGFANMEMLVPATPQTNYLIASVTKPFTAVAVMMLWEAGWFMLDDSIGQYLDDLPAHWNPLTIRQLLNHTSGVPTNLEPVPPCTFDFDPDHYTRQNYLQEVACLPLEFPPGTAWKYSSATGYGLLGMLIEKVSGQSYWDFLQDRIFTPLEMTNTGMLDYERLIANRAAGYNYENDAFTNSEHLDAVGEFASGGLMSTVLDLAKWDAALYTEKLLQRKTLERMWTPAQLNDGSIVPSYGLGFGLTPYNGHNRVGHTGGAPGFSSSFSRFGDKNISVILLTNVNHPDFSVLKFSNEVAAFFLE